MEEEFGEGGGIWCRGWRRSLVYEMGRGLVLEVEEEFGVGGGGGVWCRRWGGVGGGEEFGV